MGTFSPRVYDCVSPGRVICVYEYIQYDSSRHVVTACFQSDDPAHPLLTFCALSALLRRSDVCELRVPSRGLAIYLTIQCAAQLIYESIRTRYYMSECNGQSNRTLRISQRELESSVCVVRLSRPPPFARWRARRNHVLG